MSREVRTAGSLWSGDMFMRAGSITRLRFLVIGVRGEYVNVEDSRERIIILDVMNPTTGEKRYGYILLVDSPVELVQGTWEPAALREVEEGTILYRDDADFYVAGQVCGDRREVRSGSDRLQGPFLNETGWEKWVPAEV